MSSASPHTAGLQKQAFDIGLRRGYNGAARIGTPAIGNVTETFGSQVQSGPYSDWWWECSAQYPFTRTPNADKPPPLPG